MTPADVDALLVHEPFVRAIARALLRGDSRVDDVVQETWLAAMQSGPNDPAAARGWLAAVVRNVVRSLLRKDAVRKKHTPPGRDPLPSAASIAAQEEIRREVLDELLALDEPYRTALLLRYYEDLPPREMAKRLEIPVETARTRVKRGLNLLRGRLDKKNGGRREAWAVALVPLALRSATAATSGAVLAHLLAALKGAHVVAAVGVVAIVGAGYLGWKSFSSGDANTPARTSERVATAPPVQDEEPAVEPAPADAVTISGIVTGPAGKPHGAATVEALPYLDMGDLRGWGHLARLRTLPRPRVVARTTADAGGRFVFAVPRGRRLVLRARDAEHFGLPLHSLDVGRDVVGVRLRVTPKGVLEGVVVSEEGTPIAGATLFAMPNRGNWSAAEVPRVVTDLEGSFSFGQLPAGPQDLLLTHAEFAPVRFYRLSGKGLRVVMSLGLPIEGTVRHQETGRPVAGAIVTVIPALTETSVSARTDSNGRYRIEHAGVGRPFRFVLAVDGFRAGYTVLSERMWSPGDQFDVEVGPTRTLRGRTVTRDRQGHVVPAPGVHLRIATYAWWTSGISYGGP